jgi:hypothetical protein
MLMSKEQSSSTPGVLGLVVFLSSLTGKPFDPASQTSSLTGEGLLVVTITWTSIYHLN